MKVKVFLCSYRQPLNCLALLIILIFGLRFFALDDFPLIDPTEGRYAEISREMAMSGDWIVPRLNFGEPFWGKPPMYFWAGAASMKLFGFTAAAARLPSLLFSFLTAALFFLFVKRSDGKFVAAVSTAVLCSCLLFYALSGVVLVDTVLSLCTVSALLLFHEHFVRPRDRRSFWSLVLFGLCTAGAILSKGLIAVFIIIAPLVSWALHPANRGDRRRIAAYAVVGLIIALLFSVPWHLFAESRSPGFLRYYLLGEHFARFVEPGWQSLYGRAHAQPLGTIWLMLAGALFPWSLIGIVAVWLNRKRISLKVVAERNTVFFLAWALSLPLLFTISSRIMTPYLLPVIPAWAYLIGRAACRVMPAADPWRWRRSFAGSVLFVPLVFAIVSQGVMPIVGIRRSQEFLIEAFKAMDYDNDASLIYLDRLPFSGEFYAQDRIVQKQEATRKVVRKHVSDGRQDYFVVERGHASILQPFVHRLKLELVLETPKRLLFREPDGRDLSADIAVHNLPLVERVYLHFSKVMKYWI
jgi:4-amino-4-deoxy-L-arabinose transferase-like glycosyltransferase